MMENKRILVEENVSVYSPKLAAALHDIDKAIILQTVYYWCETNRADGKNFSGGHYWTYNTYAAWAETSFPWMSAASVKNKIVALEKAELLISTSLNEKKGDNTKWYRVNIDNVEALIKKPEKPKPQKVSLLFDLGLSIGFDANSFQSLYYMDYLQTFAKPHPDLTEAELKRAIKSIAAFAEEFSLDATSMSHLAQAFFVNVKRSDHNIKHFATRKIMENRLNEWNSNT